MILLLSAGLGLLYFNHKKGPFTLPVQLICIAMILSAFMAYLSWGQSPFLGILAIIPFFIWPIYFGLLKFEPPVKILENVVLMFGAIYILLYFYQFSNPSNILFNVGVSVRDDEFIESRGIIRVLFPGVGIFWLATYIALTKLTRNEPYKVIWAVMVVLGLIIPFMQATRTFILPTLLVFLYHFLKNISLGKKIAIGVLIVISGFFLLELAKPILEGLQESQERTTAEGTKDIRYIAAMYFLTEFPQSPVNYFFGNGMGHERGPYGQFIAHLAEKGFFISDIGIFGIYTYFGLLAVLGWILIFFKVFTLSVAPQFVYAKYYFFNVLFGAITGSTLYHPNYMITSVFALYIFQITMRPKHIEALKKILKFKLKEIQGKTNTESKAFKPS
ncbi:hypothetical protein [Pararhodonellum marinum]|uniref:hypothetical protein n=1 Tax=Pararhodonellum marinum TaxID=2755358 RepID=UPI00188FAE9C|nr:hypothetical protein [Pararhodonellum marinum]